jgi:hypothetical protein
MTDSSFSPADAEGLAAWFARAEANAAGLRRRLRDFGTDQRPLSPGKTQGSESHDCGADVRGGHGSYFREFQAR